MCDMVLTPGGRMYCVRAPVHMTCHTHTLSLSLSLSHTHSDTDGWQKIRVYCLRAPMHMMYHTHTHTHTHTISLSLSLSHTHTHTDTDVWQRTRMYCLHAHVHMMRSIIANHVLTYCVKFLYILVRCSGFALRARYYCKHACISYLCVYHLRVYRSS